MDKKVSTVLDEDLLHRANLESMRQGKPLGHLLEEALEFYLDEKGGSPGKAGTVAGSWGVLKIEGGTLRDLLEQEDDFLDA